MDAKYEISRIPGKGLIRIIIPDKEGKVVWTMKINQAEEVAKTLFATVQSAKFEMERAK